MKIKVHLNSGEVIVSADFDFAKRLKSEDEQTKMAAIDELTELINGLEGFPTSGGFKAKLPSGDIAYFKTPSINYIETVGLKEIEEILKEIE